MKGERVKFREARTAAAVAYFDFKARTLMGRGLGRWNENHEYIQEARIF